MSTPTVVPGVCKCGHPTLKGRCPHCDTTQCRNCNTGRPCGYRRAANSHCDVCGTRCDSPAAAYRCAQLDRELEALNKKQH